MFFKIVRPAHDQRTITSRQAYDELTLTVQRSGCARREYEKHTTPITPDVRRDVL